MDLFQVYLCGRNLESVGATGFVKRLSYCPQEDTMYPRLAVADQLEIFARLRGADAATAKNLVSEALRALRIEEFSARRFESLSGGTKRKVNVRILDDWYFSYYRQNGLFVLYYFDFRWFRNNWF